MFEQKTLASSVSLAGVGLHTGERVAVEIRPADAGAGIFFVRSDLPGEPAVEASPENLTSRPRRTALVKGKAEVDTGEHLLAALFGAGVGNAEVRLDGPELPGLDGSALPYYEAVRRAGLRGQGCSAREVRLREPIVVKDQGASLIALAREGEGLSIGYTLDYGAAPRDRLRTCPQTQYLEVEITEETFAKEIAPARTFVFEDEIEKLREEGLGKGATTENTLVLGEHGVIGNHLRFKDEFVRHKILDLIGDLFLTGCRLHGHVVATKSGHSLNMRLARLIRESPGYPAAADGAAAKKSGEPAAAPARTGGLDNRQIQEILPHRYPFLLVDRLMEFLPGERAVGLKNVTCTEPFFEGHFPQRPIMPGVLIIESLAQVGGLILTGRCSKENQAVFILSLDNVKFRRAVEPGDQLVLEANLKKLKSRTAQVEARALVNGAVAAEAEILYRLIDL